MVSLVRIRQWLAPDIRFHGIDVYVYAVFFFPIGTPLAGPYTPSRRR